MWLKKILKLGFKEATNLIDAQKLTEDEAVKVIDAAAKHPIKKIKLANLEIEFKDTK